MKKRYMATFNNVDRHIPDLIADELNNNFANVVRFAATRRPDRDKPLVEMEIHLSTVADVADLIRQAALNQRERYSIMRGLLG